MIPDNKREAVQWALQTTFGSATIETIHPLTTGLSNALVYLMRQITHFSYFSVFMGIVAAKGNPVDVDAIAARRFRDFHDRMWRGDIDLSMDGPRLEYAKVHLEQLRQNLLSDRFEEALKIVRDRKTNA